MTCYGFETYVKMANGILLRRIFWILIPLDLIIQTPTVNNIILFPLNILDIYPFRIYLFQIPTVNKCILFPPNILDINPLGYIYPNISSE